MLGGLFEIAAGVVMIVVPEPATTGAGVGILADGIRRVADKLD